MKRIIEFLDSLWKLRVLQRNYYSMNQEKLRKHQEKRLQEIIHYAYQHSPYYREHLKGKELTYENLPFMNKRIMMEYFDQINTKGLKKQEIMEFLEQQQHDDSLQLFRDEYSCGLSSGTSGNRGLTVLSRKEMSDYATLLWSRKGLPPHVKSKRVLFALRRNNPSFMEVGKFGVKLVYVDYTVPVPELIQKINDLRLSVIAGPPSLLYEMSKYVNQIMIRIEALISYAEVLDPEVKQHLEERFNAPVVQIYQGSEGFIASTCKHGKLHINEDIILVDLVDIGGGKAKKVVVTDLYRKTQPILKYELNDLIELDDTPCTCGSVFRVIKQIHGRMDDIFYLKSKENPETTKLLFPDYVRRSIIFASPDIKEYQALQYDNDHIEIRIITNPEVNLEPIKTQIMKNLKAYADKLQAILPEIRFTTTQPQLHPVSKKLIRVWRVNHDTPE